MGFLDTVVEDATLLTIGYPVLAASISPIISTNTWTIDVAAEGGGPQTITFDSTLPASGAQVVSLANSGIAAAYPLTLNPLPIWEKRSSGYYIHNPTAGSVTFAFGSNASALWTGGLPVTTILAGGSHGPFQINPTLGAVSQNLEFREGGVVTLPISAAYGETLLVHLPSNTPWPSRSGSAVSLSVRYPAIDTKILVKPSRPFEVMASVL